MCMPRPCPKLLLYEIAVRNRCPETSREKTAQSRADIKSSVTIQAKHQKSVMDHICRSENGWPNEIPYLFDDSCPYIFDNKHWPLFPERMGWTRNELINCRPESPSDNPEHTPFRAAALMQTWLFFGLIYLFTQLPVLTEFYVKANPEGRKIVTTRHLPQQLEMWRVHLSALSEEKLDKYSQSLDNVIHLVDRIIEISATSIKEPVLPIEVNLSISILFRTFIVFKKMMFPATKLPREIIHPQCTRKLRENLTSKGLSECDLSIFAGTWSQLTLCFLGCIVDRISSGDHSGCDKFFCQIVQKTHQSFEPKHVLDSCRCQLTGPSERVIIKGIRENLVPLLTYSDDVGLTLDFQDVTESNHRPYIAISHVWSEGLGNPNGNEMHICQLQSIQSRISSLVKKLGYEVAVELGGGLMPFWIDTLCVPAIQCPEKSTTISRMEVIYKSASAVLVLDSTLQLLNSSAPLSITAISIASSTWFTRLWTIQEGAFAKKLFFQLRQNAINTADLVSDLAYPSKQTEGIHWNIEKVIAAEVLKPLTNLTIERMRSAQGRQILSQMRWRFCSREEDEVICLAILLGFSENDIKTLGELPADGDERMTNFLLMQKYLPSDIIFWNCPGGEGNLTSNGFSWAPKSFLSRRGFAHNFLLRDPYWDSEDFGILNDKAYVDKSGFHVVYPAISLNLSNYKEESERIISILLEEASMIPGATSAYRCIFQRPTSDTSEISWNKTTTLRRLAIILPQELSIEKRDRAFPERMGLLVELAESISEEGGDQLCYCRYRVLLLGVNEKHPRPEILHRHSTKYATATRLKQRRWCLR